MGRLRRAMASAQIDGLLVSNADSRRYLSGYTAKDLPPRESAGYLLVTEGRQLLFTDPRTEEQAVSEAPDFELRIYRAGMPLSQLLRDAVAECRIRRLGADASTLSHALWQEIAEALDVPASLHATPDLVDRLRMVKDEAELQALRASIALNDAAFAHLARTLHAGSTEIELAWEMETFARTHGAESLSFDPITVAGPNTAIPHATPSQRPVGRDEPVLFDIGVRLDGYCSDMTRTLCIDSLGAPLRDVWQLVLDAQRAAEEGVRPGMTGADVDALARDVITAGGYGEQFVHGLGHGIGLEIHEPPWITPSRGVDVLEPGMVFSIEPGIYIPGHGGVRIEDLVLLTDQGAEVLCASPKKLQLIEVLNDLDG